MFQTTNQWPIKLLFIMASSCSISEWTQQYLCTISVMACWIDHREPMKKWEGEKNKEMEV